ncbi:terminase large subunit [Bacillus sp. RG28]|uniref:Terminase large subunit n=1 Tax=Gottfriedia endophytica TaxID=2820819 RepID=A0A940NHL4_9BACI|nr:terminase TerL endonuclease subunit [Gottfriedia endophytica]MBP0725544.1 terminase large subunit [Gottfriedia endophytica]
MLKQWLIEYCHDVLNGDVIACEKHKWSCLRFLNDIEREGTEDFPYIFDEEKALRFLNWMALFKHTKGKLAGKRIEPEAIQIFIFSNIYGWIHKEKNLRRFKKSYWQVGRKNAKSQSLSCVGSYESSGIGEPMSEVYIGATKTEQAKIVWNETKAQINGSKFLKDKFKIANGRITHYKSEGFIRALSKEDGQNGDGLNVQCGIIDEYHAHKTSEIYDVLISGSGARPQPLMMIITTAGFELNNPCYSVEYKYVSNILNPNNPIENDEYFIMVNELDKDDDIKDESVWEKANPILCSYEEGLAFLRGELKAALDVPEKMRNFLTKNMNIWVNQRENGYMNMEKWNLCADEFDFERFNGCECVVGVDLSAKIDLTSISFIFKSNDEYHVLSHSFMPEDTLEYKMKTDKVPYDLWVKQGWITTTPGAVVDYTFIKSYLENIKVKYNINITEVCADPWNATQFMQDLESEGYTVVEIRQGIQTLGSPTKDFREKVYLQRVKHNNNPVLTWAIGNAVTRQDPNENIMLDKSKASDRIDPIASILNAHVRAMLNINTKSIYEDSSLFLL